MNDTMTTATEATDTATLMHFAAKVAQHLRAERFSTFNDKYVRYTVCGTQVRCFSGDDEVIIDILRVSYETKDRDLVKASPFAGAQYRPSPKFVEAMTARVRNALVMIKP